jgi:cell division GTPase FtsZ
MNILLLSTGGGGGNILRSVKTLFHRDVAVTQKSDDEYARRLKAAVTTRFLDTNEFSLAGVSVEERVVIGARTTRGLGARHNPEVAREALDESRSEVAALIARHPVIVLIGTGGKGTGAGTIFPLAQMARQQKKLVVPVFVRPSFERHEVDKRRYDHALKVTADFERSGIRFVEILNDRGYDDSAPQSQFAVWEAMNRPIARGLRGLIYVLWDLSQVDPSDLSMLFAGHGRLRIGFGEMALDERAEPTAEQVNSAVRQCWHNPYYAFSKPAGTSLICIQGDWSNIADANIKSGLAAWAMSEDNSLYNPLYTRADGSPRPWGVTALFSEHTGAHPPLPIDWGLENNLPLDRQRQVDSVEHVEREPQPMAEREPQSVIEREPPSVIEPAPQSVGRNFSCATPAFSNFREFALAVNRSDPGALALAGNGIDPGFSVDGPDVKKLLGTMWFRSVVPRLSEAWRERILDALLTSTAIPNHIVKIGRQAVRLNELDYDQLRTIRAQFHLPAAVRPLVELLVTVGRLWGPAAIHRFSFAETHDANEVSKPGGLLHAFRG